MGRFGMPEEIAKAVLFLAADADYVTGQQIKREWRCLYVTLRYWVGAGGTRAQRRWFHAPISHSKLASSQDE